MDEIVKILTLILISSVKFAFGPSFVYLNNNYDFTFIETNFFAILGGMLGVIVFMLFSDWLIRAWHNIRLYWHKRKERRKKRMFSEPMADTDTKLEIHYQYIEKNIALPPRRIFTKQSRRMVKLWRQYGLFGLAALTPVIFSIPLGTFFMTRLEKNKKKILLYMFVSICCWSLILTTLLELTHVRNLPEMIR